MRPNVPLAAALLASHALLGQQTAKSFANLSKGEPACPMKGSAAAHASLGNQPLVDADKEQVFVKGQRRTVTAFGFYDVNSRLTKVGDLKGKIVVVGFWSTQCDPSQMELQELRGFQSQVAAHHYPVEVIPVHLEAWPEVLAWLRRKSFLLEGVQVWRAGLGENGPDIFAHELPALPSTFIIDREGGLAVSWSGYFPGRLLTHINRLMNEP